jgi:hypothetical protein
MRFLLYKAARLQCAIEAPTLTAAIAQVPAFTQHELMRSCVGAYQWFGATALELIEDQSAEA